MRKLHCKSKKYYIRLVYVSAFAFVFLMIPLSTKAQGWGFTFQLSQSGPCSGTIPTLPNFTVPSVIPNQGQCEALRQTVLDVKISAAQYDDKGNYIGDCNVFYTCTPCTGSDIVTTSSLYNPGSVSIDGLTQGTAFFSPHESEALQNWINDYTQKMTAMGWQVNGGKAITFQDIPLTDDNEFNKYYIDQVVRYEKPEQGGVVYLKEGQGVVDPNALKGNEAAAITTATEGTAVALMRDPEEGKTDEFFRTHFSPVNPDKGLDGVYVGTSEPEPFWTTDQMTELAKAAVGIPLMFLEGAYAYAAIPIVNLVFEDYKAGVQLYKLINGENVTVPTTGQIFVNTGKNSLMDVTTKIIDDFGIGKVVGKTLGSGAASLYGQSPGIAGSAATGWGLYNAGP
jgi:hypothetical protein